MSDIDLLVIKVINGVAIDYPVVYTNFLLAFPTCPMEEVPTNEIVSQYGYEVFVATQKPKNNRFEHPAVHGGYNKINNVWTDVWSLVPFTEQEILDAKWQTIRTHRNFLLRQTDWTQLNNVIISNEEKLLWIEFRQNLRDIPQLFSSPDEVSMPAYPADNYILRQVF